MKSILSTALAFAMASPLIHSEPEAKSLLSSPTRDGQKIAQGRDSARCAAVLMIEVVDRKEETDELTAAIEQHTQQAIFFLKEREIKVFTTAAKEELDYFTKKEGLTDSEFQKWLHRVEECIGRSAKAAEPQKDYN